VGASPADHNQVNVRLASSRNVLARWIIIMMARPTELFSAVQPKRTNPAPNAASNNTKKSAAIADLRTNDFLSKIRHAVMSNNTTSANVNPELAR